VFARGRTLEAIEGICSGEGVEQFDVIDLLSQLVDKSLVYVEKKPDSGARYYILESIWEYANEKLLEAGESEMFRIRHLDYFLNRAELAAPKLRGPEQRETLAMVAEEEFNIRYALDAAAELPGQVSKGLRLLAAIQRFVEVRGLFKEAREVFAKLLEHRDAAPRDATRAEALAAAGRLAWVADDLSNCALYQQEALAIFRELGDKRGEAQALADLAFLAFDESDLSRARKLAEDATSMAASVDDVRLTAHVQHVRSALAAADGDFAQAYALDTESLAHYRALGDTWQAIIGAWGVGINAAVLGHFDVAHAHLTECLQVGLELGNRWGASYPLQAFAALAVAERKYDRAARLFGAADAQRIQSGLVLQAADHPAMRAILADAPEFAGSEVEGARREGRLMSLEEATALATSSNQ
jgi:hypothetical protein